VRRVAAYRAILGGESRIVVGSRIMV